MMTDQTLTIVRPTGGASHNMMSKARIAMAGAVLAGIALLAIPSSADSQQSGPVTVRVAGLRSNDGQVGCAIYNSAKGFPKEASAALERVFCPIVQGAAVCALHPVVAGAYAVVCFHDANNDGKLDTSSFGIPREGVCASNGATGSFGPPSFRDAKFDTSGAAKDVPVRMKYWAP